MVTNYLTNFTYVYHVTYNPIIYICPHNSLAARYNLSQYRNATLSVTLLSSCPSYNPLSTNPTKRYKICYFSFKKMFLKFYL